MADIGWHDHKPDNPRGHRHLALTFPSVNSALKHLTAWMLSLCAVPLLIVLVVLGYLLVLIGSVCGRSLRELKRERRNGMKGDL